MDSIEKMCARCKLVKPTGEFYKDKKLKIGFGSYCKECIKKHVKSWAQKNPDKANANGRKSRAKDPARTKATRKRSKQKNRETDRVKDREYKRKHSEKNRTYSSKRRKEHPEKVALSLKQWYEKNKKERVEYRKKKMAEDIHFRLGVRLRGRLSDAIKKGSKGGSAVRDLGCSITNFKLYLESLFQCGMRWDNYGNKKGQWSIDHIMPLHVFDLTKRQHVLLAVNYLNLRPLWHVDNLKKGTSIPSVYSI